MKTESLTYAEKTASADDIHAHLLECAADFIPPLTEKVSIPDYSRKLFEKSVTFEAWAGMSLVGLVAAYFEGGLDGTGFVTNVSVLGRLAGQGVASRLMDMCLDRARGRRLQQLVLEVSGNNARAMALYEKLGFLRGEMTGDSVFMRLPIQSEENHE
jgi:ribosomal protein S18 acetylase RimI-like enzyme